LKYWKECRTIEEYADNAAIYNRSKREYIQDKNNVVENGEPFQIPQEYLHNYSNNEMDLYQDICVAVESSKTSWMSQKVGIDDRSSTSKFITKQQLKTNLDHLATVSHYILDVGHTISSQTKRPAVIIYNARGASIYSYLLNDSYQWSSNGIMKRSPLKSLDQDKISEDMRLDKISSCVIPLNDFKISSHQYVQTEEEALKLSGPDPVLTKLRKDFVSKKESHKEYIPKVFLDYLHRNYSLIYVDVPSWGKYYASSAGVLRNLKDLHKQDKGIYKPFKFKSYVEYAQYQVICFSIQKNQEKSNENLIILEVENYQNINVEQPLSLILNPEISSDIWWDNCPQLLPREMTKYSNLTEEEIDEGYPRLLMETSLGEIDIAEYIIQWIRRAGITDGIIL